MHQTQPFDLPGAVLLRSKFHNSTRIPAWMAVLGLVSCLILPRPTTAAEVKIPLEIDYVTLGEALKHQMYNAPGGRAVLWTGSDRCQYLYATDPHFVAKAGALSLETKAELSLGLAMGDQCVTPIAWSGIVAIESPPYISQLAIKFRVTNIDLYNPEHRKTAVVGRGFDLIKGNLTPRIETFSYDLNTPLRDLEALVRAAASPEVADRVKAALATLRPESAVVARDNGLRLGLVLTVPDAVPAGPSPLPANVPLSPAEVAAWQATLNHWDAFIVFAIKQLGDTTVDKQMRGQLFDLLVDSRYRLVDALARPQGNGPDPVRLIFIDVWSRLHVIIQSAAQRGVLGDRALEFLSFVTAGDALFALDQAAPALGMRVSTDDLRRLAHMIAPQYAADPLAFSYDTDPALQQMFGVNAPLESLGPLEAPPVEEPVTPASTLSSGASGEPPGTTSAAMPTASAAAASSMTPLPLVTPLSTPAAAPSPASALHLPLRWLGPASAEAAEDPLVTQIHSLGAALMRVVVDEENARAYVRSVRDLLTLTAQYQSADGALEPPRQQDYVVLIKATAWQESCWRQYVRVNHRVRFLESDTGDVGMMQVNKHVWRGFYSIPRLEWDIVYNAGAGSQILMRLMRGAAANARGEARDSATDIARATYAAYNGGPGSYNRWRRASEPAEMRQIDDAFWAKYRVMAAGQSFDIMSCARCDQPTCK